MKSSALCLLVLRLHLAVTTPPPSWVCDQGLGMLGNESGSPHEECVEELVRCLSILHCLPFGSQLLQGFTAGMILGDCPWRSLGTMQCLEQSPVLHLVKPVLQPFEHCPDLGIYYFLKSHLISSFRVNQSPLFKIVTL